MTPLERGWERYHGGPFRAIDDRLHVTLNHRGLLLMNAAVYKLMDKPTAVLLYYNRDQDKIAVEPADFRAAEAYPIRYNRTDYRVYALSFCRYFGIRFAVTHKMLTPEITDDRRLILDLRNTTPIFTKKQLRTGEL